MQQAAFVTALVVSYARPFVDSRGKGGPPASVRIASYGAAERRLHDRLLSLRKRLYAHSDTTSYRVRPTRIAGRASAFIGKPELLLNKNELETIVAMTTQARAKFQLHLEALMRAGT